MSFAKKQLLPGEQLITLQHQHVIVLLRPVLLNIVFAALLIGISYAWGHYWLLLFCLVPLIILLWDIVVRNRREYIVTDRRVVRNEGVFTTSSFDAPLDKINNVFHEQGIMGRLLKYGRVGLETASEEGTTIFDFISHPVEFKNCIVRQREMNRAPAAAAALGQNIPQLIDDLARLRDRNIITPAEFEAKKKTLLDKM
jgi:uncharacterized membrane protein YdbT with pleckstrin-like domain